MRILLVVHGFPPAASAGTEIYTRDLAVALAVSDDVRVLTREQDPHRPELSVRAFADGPVGVTTVNNTFQSCHSFEESYANPAIDRLAGAFLDEWQPSIVHVQHLTCLSTGIPRQAVLRGIPVVVTLNDYWLLCHRGQLLDLDGRPCAGPSRNGCGRCLPPGVLASACAIRAGRMLRNVPVPGASAAVALATQAMDFLSPGDRIRAATLSRLRHMQEAVKDVDLFLAPSGTLAAKFEAFGIPEDRLARCNQGIALAPFDGLHRTPSDVLRVGFAGGFLPSKGPHVLLDAVDRMRPGSVVIDFLGSSGAYHGHDVYARALASRLGHPAIRTLGAIPHDRMPAAFENLDVLVVPSIWIENAPFIIREAFAAGLPVVASNLGGMAEMIRDGVDGLLFAPADAAALAAALTRLANEPGLLDGLRARIVRPMSIEQNAASLRATYSKLVSTRARGVPSSRPRESAAAGADPRLAAVVLNYRTADQTWLAVRSLQTSRLQPSTIVVVDNASGDGSTERLRRSLDGVRIVESPTNAGFSGGCNLGIRAALETGADRILLVNSDAVLAADAIEHLCAALDRHPTLGIAAPVLLSREEPDHVSSAGISFSRRTGRMRHRGAGHRFAALEPASMRLVDAVSGCVMLIRRDVFERVDLLDEAYFFSFEDIEFCLRAGEAGFQTGCVQDAVAYHDGGRTIGRRSSRRIYFATRNHLRLAARSGRSPLRTGMVVGLNAAYLLLSPEAPLVRGTPALIRGAWHHFTGRYGPD